MWGPPGTQEGVRTAPLIAADSVRFHLVSSSHRRPADWTTDACGQQGTDIRIPIRKPRSANRAPPHAELD